MTAFHDAVLETDPSVFISFDGPSDTTTTALNLAGSGALNVSGGGVTQTRVGDTEFTKELLLDGVNDFWQADTTLFNTVVSAAASAQAFTAAQWWRSTFTGVGPVKLFRLGPWGFSLRLTSLNIYSSIFDTTNVERLVGFPSTAEAGEGGGWQLSVLILTPTVNKLLVGRNGWFQEDLVVTAGTAIRTTSTTYFTVGSDSTSHYWPGSLGPLMIWPRAFTNDEFMSIYHMGLGVTAPRTLRLKRPAANRMRPEILMRETA